MLTSRFVFVPTGWMTLLWCPTFFEFQAHFSPLFSFCCVSLPRTESIHVPRSYQVYPPPNSTCKSLGILSSTWWHTSGRATASFFNKSHNLQQKPPCQKYLPTRHDTHYPTHSSLWQPCHNRHKTLGVSMTSKGIMVAERGGEERKARQTKCWSWHYHLLLWDQPKSVYVTVHEGQSDKRKATSCSSFWPECCGFSIMQKEVSYTHPEERREGQ